MISGASIGFSGSTNPPATSRPSAFARKPTADEVVADFLKEVKKTPIDRIRETILKKNGLTEEDFAAMSPEEQAGIQKEIEAAIKRVFGGAEDDTAKSDTAPPDASAMGFKVADANATAPGTYADVLA